MHNNYNKLKLSQMINFKKEFKKDFGFDIDIKQDKKVYHYFEIFPGKLRKTKVVRKKSLQDIYGYNCEDLFNFFRKNDELLPQLLGETENFFIFEYLEGDLITDINYEDFKYLKRFEGYEFYPFINSLYTNLIRLKDGTIKLIDLKHLDSKICNIPEYLKKNLIVFLYNKENKIGNLYIDNKIYLNEILEILKKDYDDIKVIDFEKNSGYNCSS